MWYLNFQAPTCGTVRPLANTEIKRRKDCQNDRISVVLATFCRFLSVLASGHTCPRVGTWKFRCHKFEQRPLKIEILSHNARDPELSAKQKWSRMRRPYFTLQKLQNKAKADAFLRKGHLTRWNLSLSLPPICLGDGSRDSF